MAEKILLRGGVLAVNKPQGVPSRQYSINFVRAFLEKQTKFELDRDAMFGKKNKVKVGHFGTLDPFATGVLPVAVGNATRFSNHLPLNPKRYRARLKLGSATDTDDLDGQVISTAPVPKLPDEDTLNELCKNRFVGHVPQVPPRYSAIHVNGVRAYELARQNEEFDIPARTVHIESISCQIDPMYPDIINFEVLCGGGTYIRTLGLDIAKELGTVGHLVGLQRVQSGAFTLDRVGFYTTERLMSTFFPPIRTDVPIEIARETVQDGKPWNTLLGYNLNSQTKRRRPLNPGKYSLYSREQIPLALVEVEPEVDSFTNRRRMKHKYLVNLFSRNS